jgi:hypothetical protein
MDGAGFVLDMVFRNNPKIRRESVLVGLFVLRIEIPPVAAVVAVKKRNE